MLVSEICGLRYFNSNERFLRPLAYNIFLLKCGLRHLIFCKNKTSILFFKNIALYIFNKKHFLIKNQEFFSTTNN